jgi:tetratricopeptide (TPR) repeat protein
MCQPRYPGPLRIDPEERIPYVFVLRELTDAGMDEAGLVLWQVLRDVRAWLDAIAAPDEPTLGEEGWKLEGLVPELAITLPALDRLIREPNPDESTLEAVALGCMQVGLWAEDAAAGRTALAFFQAAEDANHDNPHFAYNVGRVARKLAMYDEAEAWLKWSHWVARGAARWDVAALSLSGLGNLHRQRGNLPLAMRFHKVTRRIAQRHNLRTLEGDALYDLMVLSFDLANQELAFDYARRAITAYGPGHSRIFRMAKDVAWLWMDRFGEFESAAHVFTSLLDHIWEPKSRLMLLASLARAAAGAGWRELFESMWIECWTMIRHQPNSDGHASALAQLALGASNFGSWARAQFAAEEAFGLAKQRGEGEVLFVVESILEAVRHGVIAEDSLSGITAPQRTGGRLPNEEVATLATDIAAAMKVRRDDAPQSPVRTLIPMS